MRLFKIVSLLGLYLALSVSTLASQDSQTLKPTAKALTNADILDMRSAGLSQEVVEAKIAVSVCEFDTSLSALKALKAANVPDAVILAMVQAPAGSHIQELTTGEYSEPGRIECKHTDPIPAYSVAPSQQTSNDSPSNFVEVFRVRCGDRITLLNPDDKRSWVKIRAAAGVVGYIPFALVSREQSVESTREGKPTSESTKRNIQKATDDLEDCRVRSQNQYDTKMQVLGTMALAPMTRVAASGRLKQNLDTALRQCRSQYEFRLKTIDAQ
jgi:hypothetical protein